MLIVIDVGLPRSLSPPTLPVIPRSSLGGKGVATWKVVTTELTDRSISDGA